MPIEQEGQYNLLDNHSQAVRALMAAVEHTLGPKGMDTMLIGENGDIVLTNDGVTILNLMEVNHPVARLLIQGVNGQQKAVGDGTTTTTLLAGEIILQGLEQIRKGVPTAQVIKGIEQAVEQACQQMKAEAFQIENLQDGRLYHAAHIAGRENEEIAQLILAGAQLIGEEQLYRENFLLADRVASLEGVESQVFEGVLIEKKRLHIAMPTELEGDLSILVLDDALEPEELDKQALTTESGFQRYLAIKEEFKEQIANLIQSGVQAVFVDRGVDGVAEEMLADAGVFVAARVPHRQLLDLAEYTGAKLIRRTTLNQKTELLRQHFGQAKHIIENEKLGHIKISGGQGKPLATILIGASTAEVAREKERIAKDAAASLQSAFLHGITAGGGARELAAARYLEQYRNELQGLSAFGVDCVIAALKKPFMQIVTNAGFNALEKLTEVYQQQQSNPNLALDCDTGKVVDLLEAGIIDPVYVKIHALRTAGEVATAILRVHIIVKKRISE
ncbi:MAG: TCP-1/cpn60 chaperonin family protein [Peptococcaceae bacterium]|nr:TCP-1/cpn60 chaperonin family protein [Peptococcaceae bacterium]